MGCHPLSYPSDSFSFIFPLLHEDVRMKDFSGRDLQGFCLFVFKSGLLRYCLLMVEFTVFSAEVYDFQQMCIARDTTAIRMQAVPMNPNPL